MKIIAGLGNPGSAYKNTRHNLGFMVLDKIAEALGVAFDRDKHQGLMAQASYRGEKLLLVKPQTFMNRSGDCIARTSKNAIYDPADLLVVVDDIHLPLGKIRLRAGGSAGGHNGLKSVNERFGSPDYHRMRMGVGDDRKNSDLADHVLAKFLPEERVAVTESLDRGAEAALLWSKDGITAAMNAFNGT
tara:strand:- start:886 stop:1449 length:564 start_codon:yes stop_codon:yes gene_type:complete